MIRISGVENNIWNKIVQTEPDGYVFKWVSLRGLACWDCRFESRRRHGYVTCEFCVLPE